jgi:hypothetical protein
MMKNKPSSSRLSYYFAPRIHGNVLAWVKLASESEKSKRTIENIQRWEDDGGRVMDELVSTVERLPVRPAGHGQSMLQRSPGEEDTR